MATDITWSYDSGGGKDYSALGTWEGHTDIDFSAMKVLSGINFGDDAATDFPDGSAVDTDGAGGGHTGTIRGLFATEGGSTQVICETADIVAADTVYLTANNTKTFTMTADDSVARMILDCYDSQVHVDYIGLGGATNTSATSHRLIESSSSCTTPFAGKDATGANFTKDTILTVFAIGEPWGRIQNICVKNTDESVDATQAILLYSDHTKAVNVVVFDCANAGDGDCYGIRAIEDQCLIYNAIVYGSSIDRGINIHAGFGETAGVICCTVANTGGVGIYSSAADGTAITFNCYSMDNVTSAFNEANWDVPSDWNGADDETADLGGTAASYDNLLDLDASLDADYLATASLDTDDGDDHVDDGNCGKNPYDNVTGTTTFDNFLWDGASEDALFPKDIAGNARPSAHTADFAWDVGASEYVAVGISPTAALYGPLVGPLGGPV